MFNLFKRPKPTEKRSKDPNDFTLTSLSTSWETSHSYCRKCNSETGHREFMAQVCNSCGEFNNIDLRGRSFRKIYIDGKWKYQYKYRNGKTEIVDKKY